MPALEQRDSLQIPIGFVCQNNCIFCSDGGFGRHTDRPQLEKITAILEKNRSIGRVVFTSHEPTLNPDLPKYIATAKDLDYEGVAIITNGRRLTQKGVLDRMIDHGLNEIHISLHGHTAELHEFLTRSPGSFEQTLGGLRAVCEHPKRDDVEIYAHSTITKHNADKMDGMIDLMTEVGPDTFGLNALFMTGLARLHADEVMMEFRDMMNALKPALLRHVPFHLRISDVPVCQALGVLPMNRVSLREAFYIADQDPQEEHEALVQTRGFQHGPPCESCHYRQQCDGLADMYIDRWGWDGFFPITESDVEAALFRRSAVVRSLLSHPRKAWTVSDVHVEEGRATARIERTGRSVGIEVILREPDPSFTAYRRSQNHTFIVRSQDPSREQVLLADAVFLQLEANEQRTHPADLMRLSRISSPEKRKEIHREG